MDAGKIHRTARFVSEWWQKSYDLCFADYSNVGAKPKLSEASRDIIRQASGRQRKSCSVVAKEIAEKQKEYATGRTVNNYRHREGLKPFHVIPKPLESETHISDRLWLCNWLKDWTAEDFLHLAPSDEFYVWTVRRPNYQNDRIWAKSIEDITEDERYREMNKPIRVGGFNRKGLFTRQRQPKAAAFLIKNRYEKLELIPTSTHKIF